MLKHTKYNICSSFNDFNICKMDRTLQTNIFEKKAREPFNCTYRTISD